MRRTREILASIDRHLERSNQIAARNNELVASNSELIAQIRGEFELNREVQAEVLAILSENHREVMKRLEDLGVHMREQTTALLRLQPPQDPGTASRN